MAAAKLSGPASSTPAAGTAEQRGGDAGDRRRGRARRRSIVSSRVTRRSRGGMDVADHRAERRQADGDGEPERAGRLRAQPEGEVEEEEPDAGRSISIATAAELQRRSECSCTRSAGCSAVAATTSAGRRVALEEAKPNSAAA